MCRLAVHTLVLVSVVGILAGCKSNGGRNTGGLSSGSVQSVRSLNTCPPVLSPNTPDPFGKLTSGPITAHDYKITGCWTGIIGGRTFTMAVYYLPSSQGVAVRYDGHRPVSVVTNGVIGAPRFRGSSACWSEQAGAFYGGVNIVTGRPLQGSAAKSLCST